MHALIQTDAEIGEVLTTALIYRRKEVVAQGIGDVTRNGHPFKNLHRAAT